ncbi:MAG: hypothetical protein GY752_12230 [bacterium]|nr:hypothetical protein [bacterium]
MLYETICNTLGLPDGHLLHHPAVLKRTPYWLEELKDLKRGAEKVLDRGVPLSGFREMKHQDMVENDAREILKRSSFQHYRIKITEIAEEIIDEVRLVVPVEEQITKMRSEWVSLWDHDINLRRSFENSMTKYLTAKELEFRGDHEKKLSRLNAVNETQCKNVN